MSIASRYFVRPEHEMAGSQGPPAPETNPADLCDRYGVDGEAVKAALPPLQGENHTGAIYRRGPFEPSRSSAAVGVLQHHVAGRALIDPDGQAFGRQVVIFFAIGPKHKAPFRPADPWGCTAKPNRWAPFAAQPGFVCGRPADC